MNAGYEGNYVPSKHKIVLPCRTLEELRAFNDKLRDERVVEDFVSRLLIIFNVFGIHAIFRKWTNCPTFRLFHRSIFRRSGAESDSCV